MSALEAEEPSFVPAPPTHGRKPRSRAQRVTVTHAVLARELAALADQGAEDERQHGALGKALTACRAIRDARTPAEHEAAVVLCCEAADEAEGLVTP